MSSPQVAGSLSVSHVTQQAGKKMDVMTRALLVGLESARLKEESMESLLDSFQARNQRTKDFNMLKAAIQELEGLCHDKKPNEDIKSVLDANPALKGRIDSFSAKLGIQPFESTTTAAGSVTTATTTAATEPLPASTTEKTLAAITPEILKYLTDDKARDSLMRQSPFTGIYHDSNEAKALDNAGGTELLTEVRDFLNTPEGKDLVKYMNKHGGRGAERLRQELGQGGSAAGTAKSATEGVIPKSQIEAAKTRITSEVDALGSQQHIETMKLNHWSSLRTAAFEFCMTCVRTHAEVSKMVSSNR